MYDINKARSYASKSRLIGALEKMGFADKRFVIVCTENGRYTAIFPASEAGANVTRFAREGFMTVG